MSQYPDSNFIYVSYSHSLAKKQTQTIKEIMQLPSYKNIMDVHISDSTSAKDNFETTVGGSVYAVGTGGTITGRGAGIQGINRFGGIICLDDLIKPSDATSETVRESVNDWYFNTLQSRVNSPDTPIVLIGQRLHEDDICARLIQTGEWETVIIPALDEAGNALHPEMHDKKTLLKMRDEMPYVFSSQYMQNPQPAGGGIFKTEWFRLMDMDPEIISTFITVDCAETEKTANDATAFCFWGIYRIKHKDEVTDLYGLHWLNCLEIRVEPKDLENEFLQFYANCMRYKVQPKIVAIEKKSAGVTLSSILKQYQGIQIIDINRTKASGGKITRYLEMQPYVAAGYVSLTLNYPHVAKCIEHMRKITNNGTHAHDDICDCAYDAVKLALIDKIPMLYNTFGTDYKGIGKTILSNATNIDRLRKAAYQG